MGAVGLVDDVRPLRPPVKLVAQIVLAGLLVERDFVLRLTGVAVLDVVLTLIWVVGITNAFNLLDNMDGLAAGMAVIAGGFRLALFLLDGDLAAATMTAGFVGAVVGFLVRNAPPARIFMGDAGSLFLGFFLSGLCLVVDAAYYSRGITAVLAVPVLLVLIPIFDTTFVTVTRLLRGQPVSQGGRDHTSHRLVALGGSEGRALAVLYGLSIIGGGVALLTYRADLGTAVVLLPLLLVGLTLLGIHLSQVEVARAGPAVPGRAAVRLVQDFPYKREVGSVALDSVLIVVAYYAAYLLRFEETFAANEPMLIRTLVPVLVSSSPGSALLGAYRGMWRYTGLADLLRLGRGITAGHRGERPLPRSSRRGSPACRAPCSCSTGSFLAMLVGASRASFRLLGEALRGPRVGCPAGPRLRGGRRRRAGAPGAPQQRRSRARRGGVHRRRPGQGGHAHPRGARAGLARRARGRCFGRTRSRRSSSPRARSRSRGSVAWRRACAAHGVAVVRASLRLE